MQRHTASRQQSQSIFDSWLMTEVIFNELSGPHLCGNIEPCGRVEADEDRLQGRKAVALPNDCV